MGKPGIYKLIEPAEVRKAGEVAEKSSGPSINSFVADVNIYGK